MSMPSRLDKVYDVYLGLAFQRALTLARQAGTAAFARVLLQEAPSPPGEERVSVVLDLAKLTLPELTLLSQWEDER